MTDNLIISKAFQSSVERTERVMKVAEAFGIGLEDRDWVVFDKLEVPVNQGDVIYVTGQSGSGKSVLLRMLSDALAEKGRKVAVIDDVVLTEEPIIDQIGDTMQSATSYMAFAGISDAYLYIRKPTELSDGQRYRFRLAKLLEQDSDVWVADEFGAVLDRTTAKVVAYNLQKLARKHNKTVIVATTHTDLGDELAPDITITKRFQDRVELKMAEDD